MSHRRTAPISQAKAVSLVESKQSMRATAESVLRSLENARQECERQLRELNKPDAMRLVTGRSALDRCIEKTRAMLSDLERSPREIS